METALQNALRLLYLSIPAILGVLAARTHLIKDVRSAIDGLNGFALYFGFPALIITGILDGDFILPTELGFWLAVPISQAILVMLVPALARVMGDSSQAGTLALVGLFGNVAYLGMPLAIEVFGEPTQGVIALIVSLHVTVSVSLGPLFLTKWSGGARTAWTMKTVLKQPLFWAPVIGLVGRALPATARGVMVDAISPIGSAAAPVALFLLGLYLWDQRGTIFIGERGVWIHVALRLLIAPGIAAAVVLGLLAAGIIASAHAPIIIVLSGMPAAITTFSIAHAAEVGTDRIASTIARSTLLALVTLPILATIARMITGS